MEQRIDYEWRPIVCRKCSGIGHSEVECRRGEGRKVWVLKQRRVVDQEGFHQVGNRIMVQQTEDNVVPVHNPFNALLEVE